MMGDELLPKSSPMKILQDQGRRSMGYILNPHSSDLF